jgi:glucokinase
VLLVGDVGGSKTAVALFDAPAGGEPLLVRGATYPSRDHAGLLPILERFLREGGPAPRAACFGIAGPVIGNRVRAPNLAWTVDGEALGAALGIRRVELVNDLVALGEAVPLLRDDDLETLQAGCPAPAGAAALVAAGTGLGIAVLAPAPDGGLVPLPSEGGHMDFAAQSDEEVELLRFLRARHGHVSLERVVSGPGLRNVYDHLLVRGIAPESPQVAAALAGGEDAGQVIGEAALAGSCALCVRALDLFLRAWGAAAGNVALLALATRGVYLGGGIAPKLLPALRDGRFLDAFRAKGRFRDLLETIPVHVIRDPGVALRGAARRAARLAAS